MSKRTEVLVSGFGGQGVVRIGQILGVSSVLEGLFTTMLVSHGTETRGGYVRTQIVISDEVVDSPVVEEPTIFCALSKAAYNKFYKMVNSGIIIYDPAFITPDKSINIIQIPIPARDLAVEKLGNDIFANMILFGKIIKFLDGKITRELAIEALKQRIPRMIDENIRAFDIGYSL
ncbi:MAG TPA: 2-oxoacid:acceptor oxidoreductase family protein [Clostridium sp.]|uniref:2-oxoacid:acceptor oxidoreductase family protein n=1 Tax=Clostridium sp. TaxID=1506 RepID=UPI002F94F317